VNEKEAIDMGSPSTATVTPNDWQVTARSATATPPAEHRTEATPERAAPNRDQLTARRPPSRAPLVVALLIVALLGAVGTIVGFASGGEESTDTSELESTIATLTTERDGLTAQVGQLDSTIATLTTERDGLTAQVGQLDSTIAANAIERDQLVAQVSELDSSIATLTAQRDGLTAEVSELQADLAAEIRRAESAIADRDALAALFPLDFAGALAIDDLVGTYDADYSAAYRSGFASGAIDPPAEIEISETADGFLVLEMDGFVTAGLYRVDGALVAIADSTTAVPACDGSPRVARVGITVFPHDLAAGADGTVAVNALGASITVQTAATADCPAGLAVYGGQFAPQA
jgi:chorismate mutase